MEAHAPTITCRAGFDGDLALKAGAAYTGEQCVDGPLSAVRRGNEMELILNSLLGLALVGVVLVLATGLVSFAAGGEFNRQYSNKLMRLRVATQAFAVLVLLALLFLKIAAPGAG